jgi:hypothetical protein
LVKKLIAGECQNCETLVGVSSQHLVEVQILGCVSSVSRNINNHNDSSFILVESDVGSRGQICEIIVPNRAVSIARGV